MKSILLIGLGNFGLKIAKKIKDAGHEVMAVDKDEDRVNAALKFVTDAVIGDSTKEEFLKSLGVNNYDVCIVTIDTDFQSSLETTSLLKELGGKFVVARANRDVQEKFLLRNGADEVVNPERQMADWTVTRYTADHILDYIKLDDNYSIFEVVVPKEWAGRSIGEIDIRKKYGVNIMAIKEDGKMNLSISPATVMNADEAIYVLGDYKSIQKCFHI